MSSQSDFAIMIAQELLSIYENCLKARFLDEHLQQAHFTAENGRPAVNDFFSEVGAEVGIGIVAGLLDPTDELIPHYRGFSALIGKGASIEDLAAVMFGRKYEISKNIRDATPFSDAAHRISETSIVLGMNFSIAVGLAFAKKLRKEPGIVVQIFGDGTASRLQFGAALNFAALWKLPLLFICKNDNTSINSLLDEMSSTETVAERAKGYGIEAETVKVRELLKLYRRVKYAIAYVRQKQRPYLFEILEKRFAPHMVKFTARPFLGSMIPPGEDTLRHLKSTLQKLKIPDARLSACETEAHEAVARAVAFARRATPLTESDILSIYHE